MKKLQILLPFCLMLALLLSAANAENTHYKKKPNSIDISPPHFILNKGHSVRGVVNVSNNTNQVVSFKLRLVEHKKPTVSLDPFIRFTPTVFTLLPGKSQIVRVSVRESRTLPQGEIRGYLRIQPVDKQRTKQAATSSGMAVKLDRSIAYKIPVIIKNNISFPDIDIEDVQYRHQSLTANLSANHGSSVVHGSLEVALLNQATDEPVWLGKTTVSYYPFESQKQAVRVDLSEKLPAQGQLMLRYRASREEAYHVIAVSKIDIATLTP